MYLVYAVLGMESLPIFISQMSFLGFFSNTVKKDEVWFIETKF